MDLQRHWSEAQGIRISHGVTKAHSQIRAQHLAEWTFLSCATFQTPEDEDHVDIKYGYEWSET